MPFIPNYSDATYPDVAEPDSIDFEILIAGIGGDGVLSSCDVTASSAAFSPLSITGLVGWYDFSNVSTLWQDTGRTSAITADGQIIKGVTDGSTSGFHLSEATNGPTYKTAIQNTNSIARFDGIDDKLASTAFTVSQPNTLLFVGKVIAHVGGENERFVNGETSNQIVYRSDGSGNWSYYAGTLQDGSISAGTAYHQVTAVFNGASSSLRADAVSSSSGNPGTNALTSLVLGAGGVEFANIEIGEWIMYNVALSDANRDAVEAYLKAKWSTP